MCDGVNYCVDGSDQANCCEYQGLSVGPYTQRKNFELREDEVPKTPYEILSHDPSRDFRFQTRDFRCCYMQFVRLMNEHQSLLILSVFGFFHIFDEQVTK